jgi:hypothetical protein
MATIKKTSSMHTARSNSTPNLPFGSPANNSSGIYF